MRVTGEPSELLGFIGELLVQITSGSSLLNL